MRTDDQGNEWIMIHNASIDGTAEVTRASYDDLWSSKGWEIVDDDEPVMVDAGGNQVEFVDVVPPQDPEAAASDAAAAAKAAAKTNKEGKE